MSRPVSLVFDSSTNGAFLTPDIPGQVACNIRNLLEADLGKLCKTALVSVGCLRW